MQPLNSSTRSSSGTAVISLLLSATFNWPSTSPLLSAQALTTYFNALIPVQCPPQCFAVQRDNFLRHRLAHALRPTQKTIQKMRGVQSREDAVESVMRGNAIAQFEEGLKPSVLGLAKIIHVVERLSRAQQRADGNHEDVHQVMVFIAVDPRVRHPGKMRHQTTCCQLVCLSFRMLLHPFLFNHRSTKVQRQIVALTPQFFTKI
ncbi:MAG: hypothetical protein JWQ71_1685 [Pedosphaera sp.]|nr:hypothetical protein [Pedosphaera sp.]